MKCSCGNEAIYYQKYSNKYLCKECFIKDVERRVKKTLGKDILRRNVKIAIGISGGKDSLVMAHILKKLFKNIPNVELTAVFIDEGIKNFRDKAKEIIVDFCKKNSLDLKIVKFKDEIKFSLDEIVKNNYLEKLNIGKPCSFCGVVRRYLLNKHAKGYDFLAIGHNLDDFAQTILMNYIEGNIKNLIQFGKSTEGFVKRIKPLKLIPEEEVKLYANLLNIRYQSTPCPYSSLSYRHRIKDILNNLESFKPGVRYSILRGYEKLISLVDYKEKVNRCKICGYPCSGEVCKVCEWLKKLNVIE
ncbi:TIGR00269 family protein [Methanocaldococcus indicus]|uniref:TIGR00269 family protein n=1 Tax=Methanocaldococcus indicus TaxID=213231 RepID=UPI003C6CCDD1